MSTATDTPSDQAARLSDTDLADLAVDVLDAVLSSADVQTIGVSNWWDRATSALVTGAASGSYWPRVVSTMARRLQIDTLSERDARRLTDLGARLADPATLGRWCHIAQRDAPYLVAAVRVRRADRQEAKKSTKTPASKVAADPAVGGLDLFTTEETP